MTNNCKSTKLYFAPFQGITDHLYRNAYAQCFMGIDEMYTPFVSGTGTYNVNPSKLKDFLPFEKNLVSVVPQILSNNADEIIAFAGSVEMLGYKHINWNVACPFSRIANKMRGSGLLSSPDLLKSILDKVFESISIDFSVKARLGYQNEDEIFKVLEVLNDYPIKHIAIHCRTGVQLYSGKARPELFKSCIKISKHNLIYNGDIYNLGQYEKFKNLLPEQEEWMLGRGVLINPFLPSEIKGKNISDDKKRELLKKFHNILFTSICSTHSSSAKISGRMKAVWYYMSGVFEDGGSVFNSIKRVKTIEEYEKVVEIVLNSQFSDSKQQSEYFNNSIKHKGSLTSK